MKRFLKIGDYVLIRSGNGNQKSAAHCWIMQHSCVMCGVNNECARSHKLLWLILWSVITFLWLIT